VGHSLLVIKETWVHVVSYLSHLFSKVILSNKPLLYCIECWLYGMGTAAAGVSFNLEVIGQANLPSLPSFFLKWK